MQNIKDQLADSRKMLRESHSETELLKKDQKNNVDILAHINSSLALQQQTIEQKDALHQQIIELKDDQLLQKDKEISCQAEKIALLEKQIAAIQMES